MSIPTEPIGSIPRPEVLLEAMTAHAAGHLSKDRLLVAEDAALRDTIAQFEETGSPVVRWPWVAQLLLERFGETGTREGNLRSGQ